MPAMCVCVSVCVWCNTYINAYMSDVLHWLPVSQYILYRIAALVWRSVTGCAPSYLTDLCRLVLDLASRQALHSSANRGTMHIVNTLSNVTSMSRHCVIVLRRMYG